MVINRIGCGLLVVADFVEDCVLWAFSVLLVVGGSYGAGALVAVGFFTPLAKVLGL